MLFIFPTECADYNCCNYMLKFDIVIFFATDCTEWYGCASLNTDFLDINVLAAVFLPQIARIVTDALRLTQI